MRLADGPYPFAEPPDLFRLDGTAVRLAFLHRHLDSLCGLWDKLSHSFLTAYFAGIAAAVVADRAAIDRLSQHSGGLFAPGDWSFSALRPLPQAHLALSETEDVRVAFAFWTGETVVAVELLGSATPRRQRREALARLSGTGVTVVELSAGQLQQGGTALLDALPPPFRRFWEGVLLPASPFVPDALDEIRRSADQSVISST